MSETAELTYTSSNTEQIEFEYILNDLVKKRTLSHHSEYLQKLFEMYSLDEYLNFFNKSNTVCQSDTYHNNPHSYSVALNCYEGAVLQDADDSQIKSLLVGGLFHDFNHSQGKKDDEVNIKEAILGLKKIHELVSDKQKLSANELISALGAIKSTQYPYTSASPKDLCKQIIRDADLMMVYELEPNRTNSYKGLFNEINQRYYIGIKEFSNKQQIFGSSVRWLTQWGKVKALMHNYPKKNKEVVHELLTLKDI